MKELVYNEVAGFQASIFLKMRFLPRALFKDFAYCLGAAIARKTFQWLLSGLTYLLICKLYSLLVH